MYQYDTIKTTTCGNVELNLAFDGTVYFVGLWRDGHDCLVHRPFENKQEAILAYSCMLSTIKALNE